MKCPVCKDPQLVITERQGIEIDYCPQCRGVWLDRGELDKLIEKSMATSAPPPRQPAQPVYEQQREARYDDRYAQQPQYRKKQKSWLSEFFD